MSEANRQQQFDNEIANLDKWISEIQTTLRDKKTGTDIATARALHNKHKVCVTKVDSYIVLFSTLYIVFLSQRVLHAWFSC